MNCPQCKSDQVEFATGRAARIEVGGKVLWGKCCKSCGYFWSDAEAPKIEPAPLPKLTAPAVAPELKGVPPADAPAPAVVPPAAPAPAPAKRRGLFGKKST